MQLYSRPGSWLAVCGAGVIVLAALSLLVPLPARVSAPIPLAAAVAAIVVTVAVLGTVWWPDRLVDTSTAGPPSTAASAFGARSAWTVESTTFGTQAFVVGGRPILTTDQHCRSGVEALDPATGSVAWRYSRAGCAIVQVTGSDSVLQVRYLLKADTPAMYVYLDAATGRVLHPAAQADRITDWVGSYGIISTASKDSELTDGNTLTVVDPRTGRSLVSTMIASCPSGYGQQVGLTDSVHYRAAVLGSQIAVSYSCVAYQADADRLYAVRNHLLLLDTSSGRTSDVELPASTRAERSIGPGVISDPTYPLVVAAGDGLVAGFPIDRGRNLESQRRLLGLDARGALRWDRTTQRSAGPAGIDSFHAVGTALVTDAGVLDPATGRISAFRGKDVLPYDDGADIAGSYVALAVDRTTRLQRIDPATGVQTWATVSIPADAVQAVTDSTGVSSTPLYSVPGGMVGVVPLGFGVVLVGLRP